MQKTIVHLIDDATAGGVNRMLAFLCEHPAFAKDTAQTIVRTRRGQLAPPALDADVIVSHLSVSWSNFAFMTALRADYPATPLIHMEHSYSERFTALNVENVDRFHTLLQSTYALFDRVIAVSEAQSAWMARANLCEDEALSIIRPCVDLSAFLALSPIPSQAPRTIGAIGRLDTQKGFDILVKAFALPALAGHRLIVFGDGAEGGTLRALAEGHGNITFRPFTSDPAGAMAECDAVAMPSRWEPYGLVALEAMAAGRPLLTTRCDGLRDHLANGAIDIGENTPSAWVEAIGTLRTDEIANAVDMGRRCASAATTVFLDNWSALLREPPIPAN